MGDPSAEEHTCTDRTSRLQGTHDVDTGRVNIQEGHGGRTVD